MAELEELIENGGEDTTGYNTEKEVNSPDIGSNEERKMIPLNWNGSNWVITDEENWEYDYKNKQWANAMLSDGKFGAEDVGKVIENIEDLGSMFVWVPRFAYSINEYGIAKNGTDGETQNITTVEYLKGATNIGTSGTRYNTDYNIESVEKGNPTPMIVHPAFTYDGKPLKGIWVAKFEASMAEENLNTTTNNNTDAKTVKIVPNSDTWRYINIGNCFKVSLNMKDKDIYKLPENADTHLMKNSEWGAVAYLAASQYGVIPAKNDSDVTEGSVTHSYAGANDYEGNTNQSTTGDITGIYDMNGGAWEYVAAYYTTSSESLSKYGLDIFPDNQLAEEYEKYWDKYDTGKEERENGKTYWNTKSTAGNEGNYKVAKERLETNKNIKGDALYEALNEWSYYGRYAGTEVNGQQYEKYGYTTWLKPTVENGVLMDTGEDRLNQYGKCLYNDDYVLVGTYTLPFVVRGGYGYDSTSSGLFAFYGGNGVTSNNFRFSSGGCGVSMNEKQY